jgi:hypothetical protein
MGKYFELRAVNRGEFEALKRFPEYEELSDGTLMRVEDGKEFRIYCEDVEGWPLRVVTRGFQSALQEAYSRRINEASQGERATTGGEET